MNNCISDAEIARVFSLYEFGDSIEIDYSLVRALVSAGDTLTDAVNKLIVLEEERRLELMYSDYCDTIRNNPDNRALYSGIKHPNDRKTYSDAASEEYLSAMLADVEAGRVFSPDTSPQDPNNHPQKHGSFFMKVAGVTFEGRQKIIDRMENGEPVFFVLDEVNQYDPNAVRIVRSNGECIGFVPKKNSKEIHDKIKFDLVEYTVRVSQITGGTFEKDYGVNIEVSF